MAAMNSIILAFNYAISGAGLPELNAKLAYMPSVASPIVAGHKLPMIRTQQVRVSEPKISSRFEGRRVALLSLIAVLFTIAAASNSYANASVIEEYLEKSKANKEVPFRSDDLALECEGKDKYKCGSNVFWKW